MKTILLIAGTRPELIKLAPLLLCAKKKNRANLRVQLCVTGQHQTMANEALEIFGLNADHNLNIMKENQTPNDISAAVFERLPFIFNQFRPDLVMVQGDTTSAAAAAWCAFNSRIPVAHVEAGLRSHDATAPFPEELNRKVIAAAAQFNFCPTESARQNLIQESVLAESIALTGNTVVDALRIIRERHKMDDVTVIDSSIRKPFVLVTAHRRESFGEGIKNICQAIKQCARRFPDHHFVYPVHLNPNIDKPVRQILVGVQNILLLPPISYLNLLTLLKNCELVVSDSGGIQEEAPSFSKYCVVLRNVTERQESVDLGLSELVGTDPGRIVDAVTKKLETPSASPSLPNPYGDGHASERILEILSSHQALS